MHNNLLTNTTELARHLTLPYIHLGDTVIDATCGNGHDTLWLAEAVGYSGAVIAFDIQEAALENTRELLESRGIENVTLVHDSFESIPAHCNDSAIQAAVFNLGYLPGGDKSLTTNVDTTLQGVQSALRTISLGGIVTVTMYDGHSEGMAEKSQLLEWASQLDSRVYHVAYVQMTNQHRNPPEVLCITRKR